VRVSEAPSYGQTVLTYDPSSTGALSYLEAAKEIALRGAEAEARAADVRFTADPGHPGVYQQQPRRMAEQGPAQPDWPQQGSAAQDAQHSTMEGNR